MDLDLGRCQLEAEAPAGVDPRDGACFGQLTTQMDKLTDIHAPGEPDWAQVSSLSQRYLRQEAKDLAVACWMTAAWFRLHGTAGLAAGIDVLNDLHQTHWETMLPTRIRARRNLMAWLIEWLGKTLTTLDDTQLQPLEPEAHDALQNAWRALDDFLQEKDSDAPSLLALGSRLRSLPIVEQQEDTPAEAPQDAQQPQPVITPAAQPAPAQSRASASAIAAATPSAPAMDASSIHSAPALEAAVEKHLDALRPLLDLGVASHPSLPWTYLLSRTHAWATLETLPPANAGITRVPAPPQPEQDILERLLSSQTPDASALLQFAESRLPIYRFWLDLNHYSWKVLSSLPDGARAAAVITQEVARLLGRLPGLAELSFANEQPFANAATRQWLATLPAGQGAAPAGAPALPASPSDTLTLATAVAAASAQTSAAHALLASALERLENTAQQLHQRVATV